MTRRFWLGSMAAVWLVASASAQAAVVYNNGAYNTLNTTVSGAVSVEDNPSGPPFVTSLDWLSGGANTVGQDLDTKGSSIVRVYGGTIGDDLNALTNSRVKVYGGTILDDIRVRNNAVLDLYGGSIGDSVAARESATLNIYGWGFNYADGAIADDTGTITGFLLDGTPISYVFDRGTTGAYTGTINLVTIPEPATLTLAGLAFAATCVIRWRRKG